MINYGRHGRNVAVGRAVVRAVAPGGGETNAEMFSVLIKASRRGSRGFASGATEGWVVCYREHLEGFIC